MNAVSRFTDADRLTDAWRDAIRYADNRAFYVREDAGRLRRLQTDRYASIDGLAQARVSLLRHTAEYLAAVQRASELTAQMQDAGIPFRLSGERISVALGDDAADELARSLGILDACNEAGEEAPFHIIATVGRMAQMARAS